MTDKEIYMLLYEVNYNIMTLKEKSEILAEQKNIKNVMGWLLVSIRADYKEVRKEDEDNQK